MTDRYRDRPFPADDDDIRDPRDAAPGQIAGDPLAELARLIGQADPLSGYSQQRQPAAQVVAVCLVHKGPGAHAHRAPVQDLDQLARSPALHVHGLLHPGRDHKRKGRGRGVDHSDRTREMRRPRTLRG